MFSLAAGKARTGQKDPTNPRPHRKDAPEAEWRGRRARPPRQGGGSRRAARKPAGAAPHSHRRSAAPRTALCASLALSWTPTCWRTAPASSHKQGSSERSEGTRGRRTAARLWGHWIDASLAAQPTNRSIGLNEPDEPTSTTRYPPVGPNRRAAIPRTGPSVRSQRRTPSLRRRAASANSVGSVPSRCCHPKPTNLLGRLGQFRTRRTGATDR